MKFDYKRNILSGLVAGQLPTKYAYLGDGHRLHLDHSFSAQYEIAVGIDDAVSELIRNTSISKIDTVIDLGPGNCYTIIELLKYLYQAQIAYRDVILVDIDNSATCYAVDAVSKEVTVPVLGYTFDFEAEFLRWFTDHPASVNAGNNLVTLFGSTVGNMEDDARFLCNVRQALRKQDRFVLTYSHRGSIDGSQHLRGYDYSFFREGVSTPLRLLGIPDEAYHIDTEWSEELEAVISYAVFSESATVGSVNIDLGHSVQCFISRRYTERKIIEIVEKVGFSVEYSGVADLSGILEVRPS
jgi:hypothetical protein